MQKLLSNNRKLGILLCVAFALIIGTSAALAVLLPNKTPLPESSSASQSESVPVLEPGQGDTDVPAKPQQPQDAQEPSGTVTHNYPDEMRAVWLTPGVDFFAAETNTIESVKAELDDKMNKAMEMSMNTVVVSLNNTRGAIYKSSTLPQLGDFIDAAQYVIDGARTRGMYVYFVWDLSAVYDGNSITRSPVMNASVVNNLRSELKSFLTSYSPDGIFFDDYETPSTSAGYAAYLSGGGGIGYSNYVAMISRTLVTAASETVRAVNPGVQVGLIAGPQWAAKQEDEAGSATLDAFSSLTDGHCDTRAFIQEGLADMVAVKAYGSLTDAKIPFKTVVGWWAELCRSSGVRMYALQASDRIVTGNAGWKSADQITEQVIAAREIDGYCGSIFNSFSRLEQNPGEAMSRLVQYYNNELDAKYILTELTVTKPTQLTYSTYETTVTFMGASDATQPLLLDGKEIARDSSGYFSVNRDLKAGVNTFTFTHKNKTVTFTITRIVQIIQSVAPTGAVTVDGGMAVTLTVYAYEDSAVTAKIGGAVVTLQRSEDGDDDTVSDSSYKKYVGTYTVPAAADAEQKLGNFVFTAVWNGLTSDASKGASVTVNKRSDAPTAPPEGSTGVTVGSGSAVVVTTDQAETFPSSTLNDTSSPSCYPLPKGALDYVVGSPIVYQSGSTSYTYYRLESGLRVYASSVTASGAKAGKNRITGMTVDSQTSSRYTYITLPMTQNASYNVTANSAGISFTFNYTTEVPGSLTDIASRNPLFKSAVWKGTTLTLTYRVSNGMAGYKAYYENGSLVLRFNNPTSGISGAYIVVDPGHGGTDPGALGFYPSSPEKVINLAVARKVTNMLTAKGANVLMIDTSGAAKIVVQQRLKTAEAYNPIVYVCIHCNSAVSSGAYGNETYYYYDFSRPLASAVNGSVYSAMGSSNRGVKFGYFYVNRTSQFASILTEIGFVSNEAEYKRLLNDSVQTSVAGAIVSGVGSYLSNISNSYTPGVLSVGDSAEIKVTGVALDKTSAELAVGGTLQLTAVFTPENATNRKLVWTTSDAARATVDENGKVTGVAEGAVTITATAEDGGYKATCAVTVKKVAVATLTLNKASLELSVGQSETLAVSVAPEGADKTVAWSSDHPEIAAVDAAGKVTAVAAGTAVVTVKSADGAVKAECTVTVKAVAVTGIALNKTALALTVGGSETLVASVVPENAGNKTVAWTSDHPEIAAVDAAGKVTAVSAGTAVITAASADGLHSARCEVTVTAAVVPVSGVAVNPGTLTLEAGASRKLSAALTPENATDKGVVWESSDPAVAMVDQEGVVKGVAAGAATITATASGGNAVRGSCAVTVTASRVAVTGVRATGETSLAMKVGEKISPAYLIEPQDAANLEVSWTAGDGTVVSVDASGSITALAPGVATVTLRTSDGGFTVVWTVTVTAA